MTKEKVSIILLISVVIALESTLVGGGIYLGVKRCEVNKEEYRQQEIKTAEKVIVKKLCQYDGIKSVDFWGYDTSNGDGYVDIYMKINDKYPTVYTISGSNYSSDVYALGTDDPRDKYRDPEFYMIKGHSDFKDVKVHYKTGKWKGDKFSI